MQATGTGTDGQQTYQDATRTPQAMRHMTNKLGVEQASEASYCEEVFEDFQRELIADYIINHASAC